MKTAALRDFHRTQVKHIVGFSGGIDSQAVAGLVLDRYGHDDVILMNSNAGGNEHPLTEEFVQWYSDNVHPVVRCEAHVSDMWKTPGFAETRGFDGSEVLTFDRMIEIKGLPPSRKAQFCTEILKLRPQRRWMLTAFGPGGEYEGWDFVRYSGVRRDESVNRAQTPEHQWDEFFDCELVNPIVHWEKRKCFEFVVQRRESFNPLYTLGFNRVGCAPCIHSGKDDIRAWDERFPEMIDKIRGWEKSTGLTYFMPIRKGILNTVDEVVQWAKTSRGGRQFRMLLPERPACESKYGLCE